MKLYRTTGGQWCGTQADFYAWQIAETGGKRLDYNAEGAAVEVPTDKAGLIAWLNNRGPTNAQETLELIKAAREPLQSGPANEPMTEDHFDALPLAMQLHLAAQAVENAREQIKPRT